MCRFRKESISNFYCVFFSMKQTVITILGGTGFLGTYVVKELAKTGALIKVVSRNPNDAWEAKTAGSVGQIGLVQANIRDKASIYQAIAGSDIVINLIGILQEHGKQSFPAVHAQGAELVAKAAKEAGVRKFIHVSALGVDRTPQSKYARTKLNGEKAVAAVFPDATILRPSVVFGPEDNFFNLFATMAKFMPFLPLIGGGKTRFQPVYVDDIAKAIRAVVERSDTRGKIYELGGPKVYSFKEILRYILTLTHRKRCLLSIPFPLASVQAAFLELIPQAPLTRDQVSLLKSDNIISEKAWTFKDLGITPTALEAVVPRYIK